ncbi:hypothetical protein [Litorilituus sediminis]|uniref:Uncharacterized protein n=1 Tax=Litorilituus sediminis TaxID=718192 RepID=A0A4P6P5X6_9GAMM|nr:hypothetical protein [Litorilituus sediminis]QBG36408.1 hypothetical protein EMK97_12110 [Litorilituus sediminis]
MLIRNAVSFIISIFLYLSIHINASASECLNYVGTDFFSPYSKILGNYRNIRSSSPHIEDLVSIVEIRKLVKIHGIEKYLEGALAGSYPMHFSMMGEQMNALDFALLNNIKPEITDRLIASGLRESLKYWELRFKSNPQSISVFDMYLSSGRDVNQIGISYDSKSLNIGNFAVAKNNKRLLNKFLSNGGELYLGDLINILDLSIESRLMFSDMIDFEEYIKKYVEQQNDIVKFNQKPINNPEYIYFRSCQNFNDWTLEQGEVADVIKQAKDSCPSKDLLKCIQNINPIVAEVYMRRALTKELSKFKVNYLEKANDYYLLDDNQLGYVKKGGYLAYEKLLIDKELHRYIKKDINHIKLYRLDVIASIITGNAILTNYLIETIPSIKNDLYLGKNLAYYVTLYGNNKEYLDWFYSTYGNINQSYGISYYTYNLINSVSDPSAYERIQLYRKMKYQENMFDRLFQKSTLIK